MASTQPRSPFVAASPNLQFAWDSVSITIAKECPRRYQYKMLEGWQSKNPNSAIALAFGILVHSGIEGYHRLRTNGGTHEEATHIALQRLTSDPLYVQLPTEDEVQDAKVIAAEDEENDGVDLRNSRVRTRYYLWRTLVWYFEHYRLDPMEVVTRSDGQPAVELSFCVPVGFALSDGTEVLLAGHLDKVVRFNDQLYVSDIKTTKSITTAWRQEFDLSHQMSGYTFGGRVALEEPVHGVVIDGICLQVGAVKFARHFTQRSDGQLGEYIRDLRLLTDEYEHYAAEQYWPMRQSYCRFCEFSLVCRQPPEMRGGYLRQFFKQDKASAWNPLRPR